MLHRHPRQRNPAQGIRQQATDGVHLIQGFVAEHQILIQRLIHQIVQVIQA